MSREIFGVGTVRGRRRGGRIPRKERDGKREPTLFCTALLGPLVWLSFSLFLSLSLSHSWFLPLEESRYTPVRSYSGARAQRACALTRSVLVRCHGRTVVVALPPDISYVDPMSRWNLSISVDRRCRPREVLAGKIVHVVVGGRAIIISDGKRSDQRREDAERFSPPPP